MIRSKNLDLPISPLSFSIRWANALGSERPILLYFFMLNRCKNIMPAIVKTYCFYVKQAKARKNMAVIDKKSIITLAFSLIARKARCSGRQIEERRKGENIAIILVEVQGRNSDSVNHFLAVFL